MKKENKMPPSTQEDFEMMFGDQPKTKGESKEVKEGRELFTGGNWDIKRDATLKIGVPGDLVCSIYKNEHEEANAALIAQSKNMYYCLKDFMDIVKGISSVPTGSQLTVIIPASLFENASFVLQKATPKK